MEKWAQENEFPIVGPQVGRLLYQMARISSAEKVLELGSGFGYSSYWFASALGEGGIVHFTEHSKDNLKLAADFIKNTGVENKVIIHECDSINFLEGTEEQYDIIFNDIDKELYPLVVDRAYEKLKTGGILISDNVLWHGRVITGDESPATLGVKEFTDRLLSHKGYDTTFIPMRDGLSISIKVQ